MEAYDKMFPIPITVQVCSSCGLDWDEHVRLKKRRAFREFESFLDIHEFWTQELTKDRDKFVALSKVTFVECVNLLKTANQGPPGPMGAMGPQGEPGVSK
jgi:hypothetical protein